MSGGSANWNLLDLFSCTPKWKSGACLTDNIYVLLACQRQTFRLNRVSNHVQPFLGPLFEKWCMGKMPVLPYLLLFLRLALGKCLCFWKACKPKQQEARCKNRSIWLGSIATIRRFQDYPPRIQFWGTFGHLQAPCFITLMHSCIKPGLWEMTRASQYNSQRLSGNKPLDHTTVHKLT